MDPLSVIASVVALCQAGDRVIQLISGIKQFFLASDEIEALVKDIYLLKEVLCVVRTVEVTHHGLHSPVLVALIVDCDKTMLNLESLLSSLINISRKRRVLAPAHLVKIRWMKKKTRAQILKQRLQDSVSSLTLCLTVMKL
jgi:hypothetical protein